MGITQIDPYSKISPENLFALYMFSFFQKGLQPLDYIDDFHLTQTLINDFNKMVIEFNEKIKDVDFQTPKIGTVSDLDKDNVLYGMMMIKQGCDYELRKMYPTHYRLYVIYMIQKNKFIRDFNRDYRYPKPIIWNEDRNHSEYMTKQLELGTRMETFCDREFEKNGLNLGLYYSPDGQNTGESEMGIEIKNDMRSKDTGNFYIEIAETHNVYNNPLVASGILKNDNSKYWIIGTPDEYYIVEKDELKRKFIELDVSCKGWQNNMHMVETRKGCGLSKGFIIKREALQQIAVSNNIGDFCQKYLSNDIKNKQLTPYQQQTLNNIQAKLNINNLYKGISNDNDR